MTLNIRRATPNDLKLMQNCNLTCLPENYHFRYYMYHFASFPEVLYVAEDRPNHIVGYVLAKMEDDYESMKKKKEQLVPNGHITSISIFRTYHRHLRDSLGADYISLHVRRSNVAAIHLYTKTFGYKIIAVEDGYYNDGEDALKLRLYCHGLPSDLKEVKFDDVQAKVVHRMTVSYGQKKNIKKAIEGGGNKKKKKNPQHHQHKKKGKKKKKKKKKKRRR